MLTFIPIQSLILLALMKGNQVRKQPAEHPISLNVKAADVVVERVATCSPLKGLDYCSVEQPRLLL